MAVILDRLYNFHWITPDVARSAQPYLGFYEAYVVPHGFRSIINLRGANPRHSWWRSEKQLAETLGIAHFDVRMSSRLLPARATLVRLIETFERAPRPVLVKCSGGQDRTSFAAALYILSMAGAAARKDAENQCLSWPYLHLPKRGQGWIRHFPRFAIEDAGSQRIGDWVRERYEPENFAHWLAAQGLGGSFRALQTVNPADVAGAKWP